MFSKKGFTLIEIVVVLILILTLVSAFSFLGMRKLKEGYDSAVRQVVVGLSQAIQNYYEDVGSYPDSLYDLEHSSNPNWAGAYITYKLNGNNEISLANGRIVVSYTKNFSGNTDCGSLSNRPAIKVQGYTDVEVEGLCKAVSGNTVYFVLPP